MLVVVVLPCVPVRVRLRFCFKKKCLSASGRLNVGMPRRFAATASA